MKPILVVALAMAASCPAQVTYKVRLTNREDNRVVEVPAERYVAAVLAGESSVFRSEEALKAMAVAARTYAARLRGRHAAEGYDFCATTHCQRMDLQGITPQLESAARATQGELMWFEGKPALAVYTRDCGGETESVQQVWPEVQAPYLMARADAFCTRRGVSQWSWSARPEEIAAALRTSHLNAPDGLTRILVAERTDSGRAKRLELIGRNHRAAISAGSFRFAVGRDLGWNTLRSDRYAIESHEGRIYFRGAGEGHGLGLCQHGADEMGREGKTYREILAFYYPGTVVARTGAGFDWKQMTGEGVTVFSTNPDRDRAVSSQTETLNRRLAGQFGWPPPRVVIRVYSDVESFRNATGEPGWVAAHTSGQEIDLQPVGVLQSRGILTQTLRHELLHVAIEQQAAPGLPVWFREGVVEYLSGWEKNTAKLKFASDADLQQRQDKRRAQAAYAAAQTRTAALVRRYGEDTVLGWLRRGLPADVRNSSASSAPTNSR
ncbi:MAG TPA: SpoIID/LytB domain-containing protein [Bryobacteraceae bacterium]|nr:SpoIID/LytB domain-containing protein [Bryobacteraceae bacterium]